MLPAHLADHSWQLNPPAHWRFPIAAATYPPLRRLIQSTLRLFRMVFLGSLRHSPAGSHFHWRQRSILLMDVLKLLRPSCPPEQTAVCVSFLRATQIWFSTSMATLCLTVTLQLWLFIQ